MCDEVGKDIAMHETCLQKIREGKKVCFFQCNHEDEDNYHYSINRIVSKLSDSPIDETLKDNENVLIKKLDDNYFFNNLFFRNKCDCLKLADILVSCDVIIINDFNSKTNLISAESINKFADKYDKEIYVAVRNGTYQKETFNYEHIDMILSSKTLCNFTEKIS